ncbi:Arylsulfatase A [Sphingomonas sp. YR710]|uniref:sulfatase family protein n=1 Tax=Sphingomonas sp. YR710 TaxID=1882773 RepID=UPI000887DB92|nr:sulfatase [Sphingomonas sp. YR710]SDC89353.1 Arylsulfatase A [Sphingomonas sp. YR710]
MTVDRRSVLGAIVAGASAGLANAAPVSRGEKPNILWVVSEDNNPWIGAYGDQLARTPNIDALARRGILYRNAYCNAPVCAPSRFGILTGIYPESCAPGNHMRAIGKVPHTFQTYPELMRKAGYFCTNNAKTDYNSDVDPKAIWDGQGLAAHWRSRPKGQPFMAVFNYETTHESQLFRLTPGAVTGEQVKLPKYLPDTPAIRADYASYYNLIEKMDGQIGARLAELEADGLTDDTIIFYYSDNGGSLPRSKRYCYDEGFRCALIVSVPPKWRQLAPVAPGGVVEEPVSFIDLAPTLLSIADVRQPPQMAGKAFLGHRRAPAQTYAFGMRNRMDERIDFIRSVTDGRWRYIRNYMPHRPWGVVNAFEWLLKSYQDWERHHLAGSLTPEQGRFFGPKPYEELYDLTKDPDQIDNLMENPAARSHVERFRSALDAHMLLICDNGFVPESMAGEGWFESRDKQRYPLKRLMTLGRQAASRDPAHLPALAAALTDRNPMIRYWGATGMLVLGPAARNFHGALEPLLDDREPLVRVVAAEALASAGQAAAVARLGELAGPGQIWQVRLAALNSLTALGETARPALASIDAAAQEDQEYLRDAGRYLSAVLHGTYQPGYPVFEFDRMMKAFPKPASHSPS